MVTLPGASSPAWCWTGGASIRDLAEWLGHEDPGFTLRVYAHLLPNSGAKLRTAVDQVLEQDEDDGRTG